MTTNLLASSPAFTNNTAVGGAFTIVAYTDPIYLVHGAVLRTLSFEPPTSGTSPILDSCWVGPAAETGDGFDFDGTQVQVFFNGGNAGVTLTSGGADIVSDDISLTIDATRPLLVSFHNTAACSYRTKSGEFSTQSWSKSAVSEASLTNKTSYSASGSQNSLKSLNVDMPTDTSFHNKGIRASVTGTSLVFSATQGLPKNRTNDHILLGVVQVVGTVTISWPGDWTVIDVQQNNSSTQSVAYRYVDGGESAPTVTWSGSLAARGIICEYRGVLPAPDGIGNKAKNGGNSTTASVTSPTTTADNSLLVAFLTSTNMTYNVTNDAASYTARAFGANVSVQDTLIASAGGSQNFSLTLSPSQVWNVQLVELVAATINLTADFSDVGDGYLAPAMIVNPTVVPPIELTADFSDVGDGYFAPAMIVNETVTPPIVLTADFSDVGDGYFAPSMFVVPSIDLSLIGHFADISTMTADPTVLFPIVLTADFSDIGDGYHAPAMFVEVQVFRDLGHLIVAFDDAGSSMTVLEDVQLPPPPLIISFTVMG